MGHIVLVHGAWHGAWCWYRMLPALRALGLTPHAVELPGHGLRNGETQTLAAYAEAVAGVLRGLPEPALLVGHSMGGGVISATAELVPERISKLVYLCALALLPGDSIFGVAGGDEESILAGYMQPGADGRIVVADEGIRPCFYADCSDADVALARLLLVPQSAEPFGAVPELTEGRFGRVPRSYIVCEQDKAIGPKKQRWLAERAGAETVAIARSHSPFFSAPEELARVLKDLA
ncbi:MAG: alpha/beta fold hydrolase [Alphaproteobacteria bacterium]|nr:alpha/beta fold hydrolase [Alphaproteobacteria bacterium]